MYRIGIALQFGGTRFPTETEHNLLEDIVLWNEYILDYVAPEIPLE